MFEFLNKTQNSFGLDITEGSFKICQLKKNKDNFFVSGMSNIPLPKGIILNNNISDSKTFVYLLKQALIKPEFGRFSGNFVSVSLPESKSFVRVIQIPLMNDSELETAVPVEAESFIPLPLEQVYLDWQVLGTKDDKLEILIIACPKDLVDKYVKILEDAGLVVSALEVESQSCARTVILEKSQNNSLVVDIDSAHTNLIMIEKGHLNFTSSIPIAGNSFTESIAKALGISGQKAEIIKKKSGLNNTAEYPNIRTNSLSVVLSFCAEIKNIIKFYSEHSSEKIDKVILTGGGAKLKGLVEILDQNFQDIEIKVELADPLINIKNLQNLPIEPSELLSYSTVLGLALRDFVK